jgi:predicted nucleotidyltransferase
LQQRPKKVFLTFDVEGPAPHEDVLDRRTQFILMVILKKLKRNKLRGLLFLPGSGACAVQNNPELMEALQSHEIGYHSSTHSTGSLILQFTDIADYNEAIRVSIEKETQPFQQGDAQNIPRKGLLAFQETFPKSKIISFRAPFMSWSPPHLEALQSLGISHDFSSSVSDKPFYYRGIMFYPPGLPLDGIPNIVGFWGESPSSVKSRGFKLNLTLSKILKAPCTVLSLHPARLVFKTRRNYLKKDSRNINRGSLDVAVRLCAIELLFRQLNILQRMKLIQVTPPLKIEKKPPPEISPRVAYDRSVYAARKLFRYNPKFLYSHFTKFFDLGDRKSGIPFGFKSLGAIRGRILWRVEAQVKRQITMKNGLGKRVKDTFNGVIREILYAIDASASKVPRYRTASRFGCDKHGRDVESGLDEYAKLLRTRDSKLHTVLVLGSRVKGAWMPRSDVDVTIISDSLSSKSLSAISKRLYDLKIQIQYSDRPLNIGIVASSYYSRSEFIRAIERFDFQALDALFYGKIIYDDGFWQIAMKRYKELERKYGFNRDRLKKMVKLV